MDKDLRNFFNSDDAIYHFTKKETLIEYILNNHELKTGNFTNANDPYEYKHKLVPAFGWGWEDKDYLKVSNCTNEIDNLIKKSGFLSFSKNKYSVTGNLVQNGYEKSRMWAQYADNHYGACLVFSSKLLIEEIKHKFKESKIYAEDITYFDSKCSLKTPSLSIDGKDLDTKNISEICMSFLDSNYKKILFQKESDYKDENEFRIILMSNNEKQFDLLIDISKCLKVIVLGDKFPKVYFDTVKILLSNLDINCKKNHWEDNQYHLLNI